MTVRRSVPVTADALARTFLRVRAGKAAEQLATLTTLGKPGKWRREAREDNV